MRPAIVYVAAKPPQASSTMNVVRASKNAAVIEMAAKRSPIGNAMIFLTQRTRRERSSPRQAWRSRRRKDGGAGGGAAGSPDSTTAPSSGTASPSAGGSVGGAAVAGAITSWD